MGVGRGSPKGMLDARVGEGREDVTLPSGNMDHARGRIR